MSTFSVKSRLTTTNAKNIDTVAPSIETTPVGSGHPAVAALNALLGVKETASV